MGEKPCVVGIDFGTTSLSAVIVMMDGEQKIEKTFNYTTNAYVFSLNPLVKEQSVEILSKMFDKLMNDIDSVPNIRVLGYGFTGQMHGVVGVNKNNEAVTNLVTWEDKSGDMILPDGAKMLDKIKSLSGDRTLCSGYGAVTLYKWKVVEKRGDIACICTIADYFAGRLAGKIALSPSMAHSIGLFDVTSNEWNKEVIEKVGLDFTAFPKIVKEGSVIGQINGCSVASAIGDNQASFMGSVTDVNNNMLLNIGTGAQVSMLLNKRDKEQYEKYIDGFEVQLRPYNENYFLMAAGFINGGASYKALFNFFKESGDILFGLKDIEEKKLWENMENAAWSSFEDDNLPEVSHLLAGERKNPNAKASITNITSLNFHPSNFIAGFLYGMAKYYKSSFPNELIMKIECIFGSGNGLKRNKLFVRIIEKTFEKPVFLTSYDEEAAFGAAQNIAKTFDPLMNK